MRPAAAGPKCRSLPTPAGPKCRSLPTPAGLSPAPAFRTASKNNAVTLSRKEESLRRSCKHFCFTMSSRLFHECLKTMVSGRSERKNSVRMSWNDQFLSRLFQHLRERRLFQGCFEQQCIEDVLEGSTCAHVLERLMFQNVLESGIPPDVCETFFSR